LCNNDDKSIWKKWVETISKIRKNPTKFVDKFDDPDASDSEEEGVGKSEDELVTDSESESEGPMIPDLKFLKPIPMRPFKVPTMKWFFGMSNCMNHLWPKNYRMIGLSSWPDVGPG
jgi:hypothetical protein